jgi:hypothetical protein
MLGSKKPSIVFLILVAPLADYALFFKYNHSNRTKNIIQRSNLV